MQLEVDSAGHVTGYTELGGFVGGVDINDDALPVGFQDDFWPRKYQMEGGAVVISGVPRPEDPPPQPDPMEQLQAEVAALQADNTAMLLALADMIGGGMSSGAETA